MKQNIPNIPVLDQINIKDYKKLLSSLYPTDLAEFLENRSLLEKVVVITNLPPRVAVKTFEYLSFPTQLELFNHLPSQVSASLLNDLAPDDRTAFLEELPMNVLDRILKFLSTPERTLSEKLLSYPDGSVGRIMTTDYISIKKDWTVRQVLDYVRENGRDSETVSVLYVVDNEGKLIDDIRIRELLFASLDSKIEEICDNHFITLNVNDNEEYAVNIFRKYDRSALPVVDDDGRLIGLVTIDDILHVAIEETTQDIQMIGGSEALDVPYMQTSFATLFRKRISWLVILFLGEMLTASALGIYEDEISRAVVLALFLPLIISSGGNAGSQACTLIIRAMALGEVTLKDYWKVMKKEILMGLFLGIVLGAIGFIRISLWSSFSDIYGEHWLLIACTIFIALIGVVLWGTISGSMLPFILRRLGHDPAMSSAPFIATIVDVTGLVIYLNVAIVMLKGTLL
jgi:magnesium transporter